MDKIKIYYDGLDLKEDDIIKGYTTNPSLLKKYNQSLKELIIPFIQKLPNIPLSIEVNSDDYRSIIDEVREFISWGTNIYVKIPIINTKGDYNLQIINYLLSQGVNINITCIFSKTQVDEIYHNLNIQSHNKIIISIFSGRIADTGISPLILCKYSVELFRKYPNVEILWASTREVYNIFDAIKCGCHIITIPEPIYLKLSLIGKDLNEYSKETVQQFISDGESL
mgnify:CR=1 FL=1